MFWNLVPWKDVTQPGSRIINPILVIAVSESVRDVKDRKKTDSRVVEERDGGSVSVALEGNKKHWLTGEPVRIDRPTSSFLRELIWHQQSFYVKQEKRLEDPYTQTHVYSCGSAPC